MREIIERKLPINISDLEINGEDIMKLFELREGPSIGVVLEYLLDNVLDDIENNNRKTLIELAQNHIKENHLT